MLSMQELSRDPPRDPPLGVFRGCLDILAKSLPNSDTIFKLFFFRFFLKILSGFAGEIAKKNWRPPVGGLRMISVGTTLLVHTVHSFVSTGSNRTVFWTKKKLS